MAAGFDAESGSNTAYEKNFICFILCSLLTALDLNEMPLGLSVDVLSLFYLSSIRCAGCAYTHLKIAEHS